MYFDIAVLGTLKITNYKMEINAYSYDATTGTYSERDNAFEYESMFWLSDVNGSLDRDFSHIRVVFLSIGDSTIRLDDPFLPGIEIALELSDCTITGGFDRQLRAVTIINEDSHSSVPGWVNQLKCETITVFDLAWVPIGAHHVTWSGHFDVEVAQVFLDANSACTTFRAFISVDELDLVLPFMLKNETRRHGNRETQRRVYFLHEPYGPDDSDDEDWFADEYNRTCEEAERILTDKWMKSVMLVKLLLFSNNVPTQISDVICKFI